MTKFIVDLWLDGYDTEEEMNEACEVFINEELTMAASGVACTKFEESEVGAILEAMERLMLSHETPEHNMDTAILLAQDHEECKRLIEKYKG